MLVTLVTPVYNQAETLAATIESVLAQTHAELEYLVIDDGSTDGSLALARAYESRHPNRLKVLTQPNAGQAATLNKGWTLAQGQLLGYLSSDDCLHPEAVARLVDTLQKHPGVSMAYGDFDLIDAQGAVIRSVETESFSLDRLQVDLVCQPGPGALFRRDVFSTTGGWRPDLRQVPDFEFWLRASQHGAFVRVPEVLAQYRIHEASASFRAMTVQRADEIVDVTKHWHRSSPAERRAAAVSTALCLSAKNHAQSGRVVLALKRWCSAFALAPIRALRPASIRPLLSGLLRRAWYAHRA